MRQECLSRGGYYEGRFDYKKNIDNLITLRGGPNRARVKEEMKEIGVIVNGVVAIKEDK